MLKKKKKEKQEREKFDDLYWPKMKTLQTKRWTDGQFDLDL